MINIRKYVFIHQKGEKDCGVSCLLMIIKYYHGNVSLEYLRELTHTTSSGVSLYDLIEASKKIGFISYGVKGSLIKLDSKVLPVIAHGTVDKKYKHFIVIYHIDKKRKRLIIADPSDKIKTISFSDFDKFSSGYYCILQTDKPIMQMKKNIHFKSFIFQIILRNKTNFLFSFLFSFCYLLLHLLLCYYMQIIAAYGVDNKSIYNLAIFTLLFFFFFIMKNTFLYIKNKLILAFYYSFDEECTTNIFNHILSLPYFYYKNHTKGEIITRIRDIKEIVDSISKEVVEIILNVILLFMLFILFLLFDSSLIFLLIIMLLLYTFLFYFFNTILEPLHKSLHKKAGILNQSMIEMIDMQMSIKNLNITSLFKNRFNIMYKKFLSKEKQVEDKYNSLNLSFLHLRAFSMFLFLFLLSIFIIKKNKSISMLFTYQQLFLIFIDSYQSLLSSFLNLKKSKISFERVEELETIEEEKDEGFSLLDEINSISIRHLDYQYGGTKVFNNLNLEIKKKDKILFYGPSGSGKSTLMKMILKLIEVDNNKIFLNDMDICNYNISSLRKEVCYLAQNEILLTDTLYNNIVLYRDIGYDEFLKVSKISLVDELLKDRTLKYDTYLEENGFNLSGGERQRILLARTLLKKAEVYIFDESFSEIDVKKERCILKKLFSLYEDKTILIVSHRLSNQDLFNKKICIRDGVCYEK